MSRKRNAQLRAKNLPEVEQFCKDHGFSYRFMDGNWHIRIENVFDVYPTRKRYFWLPTKEWGYYDDYEDLGRIMMEHIDE